MNSPVFVVDSEGAIERCAKMVYKSMCDKKRQPVKYRLLCTTDWMHLQFLNYLIFYLNAKKAKKVDHVNLDIYIEEK